jgi:hypothetical protein
VQARCAGRTQRDAATTGYHRLFRERLGLFIETGNDARLREALGDLVIDGQADPRRLAPTCDDAPLQPGRRPASCSRSSITGVAMRAGPVATTSAAGCRERFGCTWNAGARQRLPRTADAVEQGARISAATPTAPRAQRGSAAARRKLLAALGS